MGQRAVMHMRLIHSTPVAAVVAVTVALTGPVTVFAAPAEETAVPEPAAEEDPELAEAMLHFRQGIGLYEEEDFEGALFEFNRAYELAPDYRLLYNIGVTQLETKDYAGSKRSLEAYLAQGGDEVGADRRQEVDDQLATLAGRVGTVTIDSNVEGASVRVDGEEVGVTPLADALVLNLGRRKLEVTAEGHQPYVETLDITGGAATQVDATLQVEAAAPSGAGPVPPPTDPGGSDRGDPDDVRGLTIATYVSLGLTGLVGGGAIVTGVLALRADDDLQSELEMMPADPDDVQSAEDRRRTLAVTTDVLIGVTAALAATTIGLGVATIVRKKKNRARTDVAVVPGGVRIRF